MRLNLVVDRVMEMCAIDDSISKQGLLAYKDGPPSLISSSCPLILKHVK